MAQNEMSWIVIPGQKYCPFLPLIPVDKPITGAGMDLYPSPCIEKHCAIYESCQGADSPAARKRQIFPMASSILRGLGAIAFLPAALKAELNVQADKIDAQLRPVPPEAPTA